MIKALIDECLSPELAMLARARGHPESSHVVWIGKRRWQDWNLMPIVVEGDWTFVTRNSIDFRGPAEAPGKKGRHGKAALHAGLICLNGPPGMDLDLQLELFGIALDALAEDELINQCLEVTIDDEFEVRVRRYALPIDER